MNRRGFFSALLVAPLAAVAALKAKARPLTWEESFREDVLKPFVGTSWSDVTSSPVTDIEAAMTKIRAGTSLLPQPDRAWLGRDAFAQGASALGVEADVDGTNPDSKSDITLRVRVVGADEATQTLLDLGQRVKDLDRSLTRVRAMISNQELRRVV